MIVQDDKLSMRNRARGCFIKGWCALIEIDDLYRPWEARSYDNARVGKGDVLIKEADTSQMWPEIQASHACTALQ